MRASSVKYHLACCAVPVGETVGVLYREIPTNASGAFDTRLTIHFSKSQYSLSFSCIRGRPVGLPVTSCPITRPDLTYSMYQVDRTMSVVPLVALESCKKVHGTGLLDLQVS